MTWTRTTLATGFSVKRAGINPGAPGFVYPFYPHKSMRRGSAPPHLLGTLSCSLYSLLLSVLPLALCTPSCSLTAPHAPSLFVMLGCLLSPCTALMSFAW